MMNLGDIKPRSLREIEALIWKNLYLVARCELTAKEMMDRVLDSIVNPELLDSFRKDRHKLRKHFKEKFDPIRDHTGFFFPGKSTILEYFCLSNDNHVASGAIIKQEMNPDAARRVSTAHLHSNDSHISQEVTGSHVVTQDGRADQESRSGNQSGGDVDHCNGVRVSPFVEGASNLDMLHSDNNIDDGIGGANFDAVRDDIAQIPDPLSHPLSSTFGNSQCHESSSALPLSPLSPSPLHTPRVSRTPEAVAGIVSPGSNDDDSRSKTDDDGSDTDQETSTTSSPSTHCRSLSPGLDDEPSSPSVPDPAPTERSTIRLPPRKQGPRTSDLPVSKRIIRAEGSSTQKSKAVEEDSANEGDVDVNMDSVHASDAPGSTSTRPRRKRKRHSVAQGRQRKKRATVAPSYEQSIDDPQEDVDMVTTDVSLQEVSSVPRFEVHGEKEVR